MLNGLVSNRQSDKFRSLLQHNKAIIAVELFILVLIIILIPSSLISTPLLVILGWLSLRLRGELWRDVGLSSPSNLTLTVFLGIALGLLTLLSDLYLLEPLLMRRFGTKPNLEEFAPIQGNILLLLVSVILIAWLLAAFGEEMAYRGYVLNRFRELLGGGSFAWIMAVLVVSSLFGFIHLWQGVIGVVMAIKAGLIFGGLYLMARRNLWLPLITHGVYDTGALVLIFLGTYPGM